MICLVHGGRVLPAVHVMAQPAAETWCGEAGYVTGPEARWLAEGLPVSVALSEVAGAGGITHRLTESPDLVTCGRCQMVEIVNRLERQPRRPRGLACER